jgi:ribulose-phosphate 3-epimerase
MNDIIPAILAKTETEFRERLAIAEKLSPMIQIDVMDGHFVPNATWFDPMVIANLASKAAFELHLMVSDPTSYIGAIQDAENIARIIWHIEVPIAHDVLINWCKKLKVEAGIAISPETPVSRLAPFAEQVKEILVMGVNPGFSGQPISPGTIEKALDIHTRWPKLTVGFDGGVGMHTIAQLKNAGVTRFCVASSLFHAEDPKTAFAELQNF